MVPNNHDIRHQRHPLLNILKGGWVEDHPWFTRGCISYCKNNSICIQACIIHCKNNGSCVQGSQIRCKNCHICMTMSWECCKNNGKSKQNHVNVSGTSSQVLSSSVPAHRTCLMLLMFPDLWDAVLLQDHQNLWFQLRRSSHFHGISYLDWYATTCLTHSNTIGISDFNWDCRYSFIE